MQAQITDIRPNDFLDWAAFTKYQAGSTDNLLSVLRSNRRLDGRLYGCHHAGMNRRRIYDDDLHAHFVTYSCYRRRRLLDHDQAKRIVLGVLNDQLVRHAATCIGFVVMPDHVHAIVWFPVPKQLSEFMKQWKRMSSVHIHRLLAEDLRHYGQRFNLEDPVWQPKYYPFNLYSSEKTREKLTYMHQNPVRAGLVRSPADWPWSSYRHYEYGRSVGVPVQWIE